MQVQTIVNNVTGDHGSENFTAENATNDGVATIRQTPSKDK